MMSLVNEVFKVYNYVPVYNCNQQYKVLSITLFFDDLWLLLLFYVFLLYMYIQVCLLT